jgi:CheY-like chemotaxis protein
MLLFELSQDGTNDAFQGMNMNSAERQSDSPDGLTSSITAIRPTRGGITAEQAMQWERTASAYIEPVTDDPITRAMVSLGLFSARVRHARPAGVELGTLVRVALADDDPLARLAIAAMINRGAGLVFVGAARGVREIVEVATVNRAEAVVLDWLMPDGGGAEAARRLLAHNPGVGIVAVTASDSGDAAREMRLAGASGVLAKGGSAQELSRAIHQALEIAA